MVEQLKYKIYREKSPQVSGAISYQVLPDYNTPYGMTEATEQEARDYITQLRGMGQYVPGSRTGPRFDVQGLANDIEAELKKLGQPTGTVREWKNPRTNEILTNIPQSQIDAIIAENAKIASGELVDLGGGRFVPINTTNIGGQQQVPQNLIDQFSNIKSQAQQLMNTYRVGNTNVPSGTMPLVNANTSGTTSYVGSQIDTYIKGLQEQLKLAQQNQQQQTSGWRSLLTGAKSPGQVRTDALSTTGINPSQYFSEEKASIEELNSLQQSYNNKVAERDQALLNSANKLAPMTFIRGEQALIQNQYAIELNRQSANINGKAAILEAKQGRWEEAQKYAEAAVSAAVAEQAYNLQMYQMFYNENQDIINGLSSDLRNALNQSIEQVRWEYEQKATKEQRDIQNALAWAQEKRLSNQAGLDGTMTGYFDSFAQGIANANPNATPEEIAQEAVNTAVEKALLSNLTLTKDQRDRIYNNALKVRPQVSNTNTQVVQNVPQTGVYTNQSIIGQWWNNLFGK
jgi:hypothetical protein